jgi:S1-C subfamily serine protease
LRVHRVGTSTFAADAGLKLGDLLVQLAGVSVFRRSDVWAVNGLVPPGTEVAVQYVRSGELCTGRGRLSPVARRALGE